MDPHNSLYGGSRIVPEVYNYLIRSESVLRPDLGVIYDLATSHELADDKVTWTFTLRDGATITPNDRGVEERALDSDEVVKSWDRIVNVTSGANGFGFFNRWVESYDPPDATTLRLVIKTPYAWVLDELGDALKGANIPREWLGSETPKGAAVGAGPWVLQELAEGECAPIVPTPNFYDSDLPYLDEYRILTFSDIATQSAGFTTRQLDIFLSQDLFEAQELEKTIDDVTLAATPSTSFKSFWMRTDVAPWNEPRVRRGMRRAMNRPQHMDVIGKGLGEPVAVMRYALARYALSADEVNVLQPLDPADAKKLFEAASVGETSFTDPTSSNMRVAALPGIPPARWRRVSRSTSPTRPRTSRVVVPQRWHHRQQQLQDVPVQRRDRRGDRGRGRRIGRDDARQQFPAGATRHRRDRSGVLPLLRSVVQEPEPRSGGDGERPGLQLLDWPVVRTIAFMVCETGAPRSTSTCGSRSSPAAPPPAS